MTGETAALVFGLASALSWGAGDFCGGLATRRASVLAVLAIAEASGLVLLVALALLFGEAPPTGVQLGWSVAAGVAGMIGLGALYQGLAVGRAAVVAPTSAVISAALPVTVALFTDGLPGLLTLAGFAAGLMGIWLVAGGQGLGGRGLSLALVAGVGFGLYFILIHQASRETTFWPTSVARAVAMIVVLTGWGLVPRLRATPARIAPRVLALATLGGALDAGGNAFFALAGQAGRLDTAAVLSALYPATTVLLGLIVLRERITPLQTAGLAATLTAIVLIAS
jgi:drug/metabolite transporter (DMT)-like permease